MSDAYYTVAQNDNKKLNCLKKRSKAHLEQSEAEGGEGVLSQPYFPGQ